MKNQRVIRGMIFLLTLVSLLIVSALPQNSVFAEDVVRLTIKNNSDRDAWLRLDGPTYYYLHVKAGETKVYTPLKGVYDYTFHHCGTFVKGEMDLTKQQTLEVPDCGWKAHYGKQDPTFIDAGRLLNLVNVTFENETGHQVMWIIEGPTVHVFTFQADKDIEYTIPMGYYDYTMYGCGGIYVGRFFARYNKVVEIECP
jgi:hypothetical protein